jgi:hypothetical protein
VAPAKKAGAFNFGNIGITELATTGITMFSSLRQLLFNICNQLCLSHDVFCISGSRADSVKRILE